MQSPRFFLFLVVLFGCIGQFGIDVYTPSLPAIADHFNTSMNLAQFSLAIYMAGVAFSLLIYGLTSEGYGRRKPLMVGMLIMLTGSIICARSISMTMLLVGRLVQGLGAGAAMALWRSIFGESFSKSDMAKYGSYLLIAVTFIMPLAPTIGGHLHQHFGWQGSFVFLAGYSFVAFMMILFYLPETSKHHSKAKLQLLFIRASLGELLTSPVFMGTSCAVFMTYGAFFAIFAITPVLLIHQLEVDPVSYGWISTLTAAFAMASAGLFNSYMAKRKTTEFMLRLGWSIMFLAGASLLAAHLYFGMSVYSIMAPIVIFYFGVTLIWPNAFPTAFSPFRHIAGYAGALYSFIQIAGGAVMGSIIAYLPDTSPLPLALVFMVLSLTSWLIFELIAAKALSANRATSEEK